MDRLYRDARISFTPPHGFVMDTSDSGIGGYNFAKQDFLISLIVFSEYETLGQINATRESIRTGEAESGIFEIEFGENSGFAQETLLGYEGQAFQKIVALMLECSGCCCTIQMTSSEAFAIEDFREFFSSLTASSK